MKMKLKNTTPHSVVINGVEYAPSSNPLRVGSKTEEVGVFQGIPISLTSFDKVESSTLSL